MHPTHDDAKAPPAVAAAQADRASRRRFLRTATVSALAAAVAPHVLVRRAAAARSASGSGRVLVLLELGGGNDGLNTVVPFGDDAYQRARGDLALGKKDVLPLADGVGLHPSLAGFAALFDAGRLAILEGMGYPQPIRSHFLSMDVWHGGDERGRDAGSGWLARLADHCFGDVDDPNLLVAVGARPPFSCDGGEHRPVALAAPGTYRIYGEREQIEALDAAVRTREVSDRAREFLRRAYKDARASSDAIRGAVERYAPAAEYGASPLARDLRTAAALIAGEVGARIVSVQSGGFDTHSAQRGRHERLLRDLGGAVKAFQDDLEAHGLADRVLVVAFSEFGRRVAGNGSGGTDHGTAGPMFAIGKEVRGGFHGKRPSLDVLDQNGDLAFTTDFRRAYATVIERWFEGDTAAVLGEAFEPLAFV